MFQKKLSILLIIAITVLALTSNVCTILMTNDGYNVWVGNNEDGVPGQKYRMWYYSAKNGNNSYMIWTELATGKFFYRLIYLMPQGGLYAAIFGHSVNTATLYIAFESNSPMQLQVGFLFCVGDNARHSAYLNR